MRDSIVARLGKAKVRPEGGHLPNARLMLVRAVVAQCDSSLEASGEGWHEMTRGFVRSSRLVVV